MIVEFKYSPITEAEVAEDNNKRWRYRFHYATPAQRRHMLRLRRREEEVSHLMAEFLRRRNQTR